MAVKDNWTVEQITVVLYEYCRKPFGQFSGTKPFIEELGELIGRSSGAIVRKVGNLASFDPQMKARGVGGLTHAAKLDKVVWDKYYGHWDQLVIDAEMLLAKFRKTELEDSLGLTVDMSNLPKGKERIQEVKKRINQDFFRKTVLSSYNNKCCITGINNPSLIEACHIVGWSEDEANRTNPRNGLSLNRLFHKAYDENFIGISPDYEVFVSEKFFGAKLKDVEESTISFVRGFNRKKLILPHRFYPDRDMLAMHYEKFCKCS